MLSFSQLSILDVQLDEYNESSFERRHLFNWKFLTKLKEGKTCYEYVVLSKAWGFLFTITIIHSFSLAKETKASTST